MQKSNWLKYTTIVILFFLIINITRVWWMNEFQPTLENFEQTTIGEIDLSHI